MNAIPLAMPDGAIKTYCCGACLDLIPYVIMRRPGDTDESYIDRHREAADRCCRCGICGSILDDGNRVGRGMCKVCWNRQTDAMRWRAFGRIWKDIAHADECGVGNIKEWRRHDEECDR